MTTITKQVMRWTGITKHSTSTSLLLSRHDGHKEKALGYYRANDNIVKYGFWVVIALVLLVWWSVRIYGMVSRCLASKSTPQHETRWNSAESGYLRHVRQGAILLAHFRRVTRLWTYPRLATDSPWKQYFAPPTLGQALFLLLYWMFIMCGLWTNVIFESPSKAYGIQWEVVGFRAAWVSTTQLPLLYATGSRFNIISLATGITHERLNWFHRWIARTIFMTLILHWSFFLREWVIADFVKQEFEMMPMVIWGFVAWGAIGLIIVSGFGWFRDRFFEAWLVSHLVSAWAVLGLSYTHTHCTTYFVGASVAILLFDIAARTVSSMYCNVLNFRALRSAPIFGHRAKLQALSDCYCRVQINEPGFTWKAGQHIYITVPSIHPKSPSSTTISLIVKKRSGFTKSLHDLSTKPHGGARVFLQGPYGNPPDAENKDSAIFVTTGNRASFTISMMSAYIGNNRRLSNIVFHWIVPDARMPSWYSEELRHCVSACKERGIDLLLRIYITQSPPWSLDDTMPLGSYPAPDPETFYIERGSTDSDQSSVGGMKEGKETEVAALLTSHCDTENEHPSTEKKSGTDPDEDPELEMRAPLNRLADSSACLLQANQYSDCDFLISDDRPSADELIRPYVIDDLQKIAVVVAAPSTLAAETTRVIGCLLKKSGYDIVLWIEEN